MLNFFIFYIDYILFCNDVKVLIYFQCKKKMLFLKWNILKGVLKLFLNFFQILVDERFYGRSWSYFINFVDVRFMKVYRSDGLLVVLVYGVLALDINVG